MYSIPSAKFHICQEFQVVLKKAFQKIFITNTHGHNQPSEQARAIPVMVSNFGGKWAPLQGENLLAGPSFVAPKQAGSLGSPAYHFLAPLAVAE